MHKNALFLLKNCKSCPDLRDSSPDPLASGGWGLRPQITDSLRRLGALTPGPCQPPSPPFRNPPFCSCNYSGGAPCFRRRKNYATFRLWQTQSKHNGPYEGRRRWLFHRSLLFLGNLALPSLEKFRVAPINKTKLAMPFLRKVKFYALHRYGKSFLQGLSSPHDLIFVGITAHSNVDHE